MTLVSRSGELLEADVGGEVIGLDVRGGQCFAFNSTATRVWRLLETPRTLDAICDCLTAEHDVDRDTCMVEVGSLVRTLAADGLVRLSPAP